MKTKKNCKKKCIAFNLCKKDTSNVGCKEIIKRWLSQEAEEDTVYISNIGKMPKTDKKVELTEQAYKDILARIDKLENKTQNEEKISDYSREMFEKEKTADEMFEKLGYITHNKHLPFEYILGRSNVKIVIRDNGYSKHIFDYENNRISQTITEDEDKAIHKKLEELKNENNKN